MKSTFPIRMSERKRARPRAGIPARRITFGIYGAWFKCNLNKFWAQNTRINLQTGVWSADFHGQGGDYFVLQLVGRLLTMVTLGIYFFWFQTKLIKFEVEHTAFRRIQ